MRTNRLFVLAMLLLFSVTSVAVAQEGRRQRGGFGGFGGFGGGRGFNENMLSLLAMEEVQKEIEVDDDQKDQLSKLRDELRPQGERPDFQNMSEEEREKYFADIRERMQKADEKAREILLPKQVERLEQLLVQRQGIRALSDAKIQEKLELTDEQKEKLTQLQEEYGQKMGELFQGLAGGGGGGGGNREAREENQRKFRELREEADKNTLAVLSEEQQKKFEELKGEPFEFPQRQFGGFGGRGEGRRGGRPEGEGDRPRSDNN